MIDRSYLPFQSAREYQDTGMQKWTGFFLSEHHTALAEDANPNDYQTRLTLDKKLLLLNQLYANQLFTQLDVLRNGTKKTIIGTVPSVTETDVSVKTDKGYLRIKLDDILNIQLYEEDYDEPA